MPQIDFVDNYIITCLPPESSIRKDIPVNLSKEASFLRENRFKPQRHRKSGSKRAAKRQQNGQHMDSKRAADWQQNDSKDDSKAIICEGRYGANVSSKRTIKGTQYP